MTIHFFVASWFQGTTIFSQIALNFGEIIHGDPNGLIWHKTHLLEFWNSYLFSWKYSPKFVVSWKHVFDRTYDFASCSHLDGRLNMSCIDRVECIYVCLAMGDLDSQLDSKLLMSWIAIWMQSLFVGLFNKLIINVYDSH